MSKKLRKYVKRELESGSSKDQVKKTLISAGWEEGEVEKALSQVVNGKEVTNEEVEKNIDIDLKGGDDRSKLVLLVLVVLVMFLLLVGLFMAFTSFDPRMLFEL